MTIQTMMLVMMLTQRRRLRARGRAESIKKAMVTRRTRTIKKTMMTIQTMMLATMLTTIHRHRAAFARKR